MSPLRLYLLCRSLLFRLRVCRSFWVQNFILFINELIINDLTFGRPIVRLFYLLILMRAMISIHRYMCATNDTRDNAKLLSSMLPFRATSGDDFAAVRPSVHLDKAPCSLLLVSWKSLEWRVVRCHSLSFSASLQLVTLMSLEIIRLNWHLLCCHTTSIPITSWTHAIRRCKTKVWSLDFGYWFQLFTLTVTIKDYPHQGQ